MVYWISAHHYSCHWFGSLVLGLGRVVVWLDCWAYCPHLLPSSHVVLQLDAHRLL
jgi:hypothetical protein